MESIGKCLKNLREEKHYTLEHISEQIRIKVRILRDIENDNFENLGGDGYAKALILNYAAFVGADEQKILNKYNETHQSREVSYVIQSPKVVQNRVLFSMNIIYIILLVILVIALTLITLHFNKSGMLKSPFKSTKTEQKEIKEIKPKNIKPKAESKVDIQSNVSRQIKILDKNETKKITINQEALNDTTNYLNELMFKDKVSPYKLDE